MNAPDIVDAPKDSKDPKDGKKPQSQQCTRPAENRSFGDNAADAIVGFGDAFLIPILVRDLFDIQGDIDFGSSAYNGGKIVGIVEGLVPLALEGAAAYSAVQAARGTPSIDKLIGRASCRERVFVGV